jgi:acetoin utilization protein AcuB
MLVRDRMSAPPITIRSDADYGAALDLMQKHGVHHVPVLGPDGGLAGIVAERDLLLAATRYLQSGVDVADVMHRGAVTVKADAPIERAAALMSSRKIGGLPVMDGGDHVVGVITETDLLAAFVDVLREGAAESTHAARHTRMKRARRTTQR